MDLISSIATAHSEGVSFLPEVIPYAILVLNYILFQLLRSLVDRLFVHYVRKSRDNQADSSSVDQNNKKNINERNNWLLILRLLIVELISTCELCADCAELNVVYEKHGSLAYGLALFVLTYVWIETFGDAHTTPGYLFEDYVWKHGNTMLKSGNTYARFIGQSLAMPIAWRLATVYWRFHLLNEHKSVLSSMSLIDDDTLNFDKSSGAGFISLVKQYKCKTSLTTTPFYGFAIELVCCMLCRLVELIGQKLLEENQVGQRVFSVFCSFISSLLVVMALELSGGYFNPILASSLEFGCQGIDVYQHALVFWLGPLVGHVVARGLFKRYVSDKCTSLVNNEINRDRERSQRPLANVKSTSKSVQSNKTTTRSTTNSNKSVHYENSSNKPDQSGTQRSQANRRRRQTAQS